MPKWTRRDLLAAAAGAVTVPLVAGGTDPLFGSQTSEIPGGSAAPKPGDMGPYDCIVLGAGIAGVTAARNMRREGRSVLLIEGSSRIGGRMFSKRDFVLCDGVPDPRYPMELGAEYVHVGNKKPYQEFWDELEYLKFYPRGFLKGDLDQTGRVRVWFPGWSRPRTGRQSLLSEFPHILRGALILQNLEHRSGLPYDQPAGRYVDGLGYKGKGKSLARYSITAHTPGILGDNADTISVAGLLADNLPAQFLEQEDFRLETASPDDARKRIICGYDTLPARIAAEFTALGGRMLKEHRVIRVRPDAGGKIRVTAKPPDGPECEFVGRTAVCTFSVGMLDPVRGRGETIFGELLTTRKRQALGVVKMGAITKLSIQFRKRVWGGLGNMAILCNPRGKARTFFSSFPNTEAFEDEPYVLTALLMGVDHELIRSLSDEEALRHVLCVLEGIYNRTGKRWKWVEVLVGRTVAGQFVPNYHRQDWERDPFALGGNSFLSYHDKPAVSVECAREALKDPLKTLPLFWAGEATAPAYQLRTQRRPVQPLCVHGAYTSGARVAEDVHAFLSHGAASFPEYYHQRYCLPETKTKTALERELP